MHPDELQTDPELVARLLRAQFPALADLPLSRLASTGTDHAIYRIGPRHAARLPLRPGKAAQVEKEARWVPRLADSLPLQVPRPIALGRPTAEFRSPWLLTEWLAGDALDAADLSRPVEVASSLARFILALRSVDPRGGPPPGDHNFGRGEELVRRDELTRQSIGLLGGELDPDRALARWSEDLELGGVHARSVWVHGDLCPGNLLRDQGRLSGVIDWSGLAVGDPAVDLLPAWNLFDAKGREAMRSALDPDDKTWRRGRAWALSQAVVALPYYLGSNPSIVAQSRRILAAVLSDAAT